MTMAILGSALFFVAAPSVLAGLIPWWMTHWEFLPPFFDLQATRIVGIVLIVAGLPGLVDSFARFALQGLGTPAPIAPPQNLVVTGLYHYVRNPMYVHHLVRQCSSCVASSWPHAAECATPHRHAYDPDSG